ncbi:MAG: hypothetical protein ACLPY1_21595 [Terracidiphilus sp.]
MLTKVLLTVGRSLVQNGQVGVEWAKTGRLFIMKVCQFLLLVSLATVTCAQSIPTSSSPSSSTPLHSLAEARIFALGGVGFSSKHSQEELQFKAIFALDRDKAKQELERLYSSENPQAMSYALVGMRKLDSKRYAELLAAARASNVTVTTMWGCIVDREKLSAVANDLDSGKYDGFLFWMEKLPS